MDRKTQPEIETQLQILICTIGEEGIRRVCRSNHPRIKGAEYLVAWQQPDGEMPVPEQLKRDDFRILIHKTHGVSVNRNFAIDALTAPLAVMSDDDVSFDKDEILGVIEAFRQRPEMDLATFRYHSESFQKNYSENEFDLRHQEKGYYVSCIEIAFRTDSVKGKIRFNEHFGFSTDFYGGEEGIFLHDALKAGLDCRYIPQFLCRHDGSSTGQRDRLSPKMIETKGAQFKIYYPWTWPLRMLAHLWRERRNGISAGKYLNHWIRGVTKARKLGL